MEGDWQETTRIEFPGLGNQPASSPCAALCFDTKQDLLWTGNNAGRVTSFHGSTRLQRYTSYRGHANEGAVRQLLSIEGGILSISSKSIHLSIRRGLTQWHLQNEAFVDLTCMCIIDKQSQNVLLAGRQRKMFVIDTELGQIIRSVDASDAYTDLQRGGPYICAAAASGRVHLLHTHDFSVQKEFSAHSGLISDIDTNNDFLVTCGYSPRQHYGDRLDTMAKVFDLKSLRPMAPIVFHPGAAFIRLHPRMSTTAVIASQNGQMQTIDITNPAMATIRHISLSEESYLVGLDVAPSGNALILNESAGYLQLWGRAGKMNFTDYSNPVEFADSNPSDKTKMDFDSTQSFSSIGVPHYREPLFSAWPNSLIYEVGSPPAHIDQALLSSMKERGYAMNPRTSRRYEAPRSRSDAANEPLNAPKFLSEQAKDPDALNMPPRRMSEMMKQLDIAENESGVAVEVPAMYRNVEIKYSKFGVDDFDFEFYNRTQYSGLETHIANSHLNAPLQLLHFTSWIRNLALHHTATACEIEECLLCEMGFLFDMLEKAQGQNCQATNFLRAFGRLDHPEYLKRLADAHSDRLSATIQGTVRYLLDESARDLSESLRVAQHYHLDGLDVVEHLQLVYNNSTRLQMIGKSKCFNCAQESEKDMSQRIHTMIYESPALKISSFSQAVKTGLDSFDHSRGWCTNCGRYKVQTIEKAVETLPTVLHFSAAVDTEQARKLWTRSSWLPTEIGVVLDRGKTYWFEGKDLENILSRRKFVVRVYQLVGYVAEIRGRAQMPHLVSVVNGESLTDPPKPLLTAEVAHHQRIRPSSISVPNDWHLFNDFLVRQIPEDEALHFDASWKLPAVLTFQASEHRHAIDDTWLNTLDRRLLYQTYQPGHIEDPLRFRRLDMSSEPPGPSTVVGIDAEFVMTQQAEIEIKSDGTTSTVRPARSGLGRVSVVRSDVNVSDLNRYRRPVSHSSESCTDEEWSDAQEIIYENEPSCLRPPPFDRLVSAPNGVTRPTQYQHIAFIDDYISFKDQLVVDYLTQYSGIRPGDLHPQHSPHLRTGHLVPLKYAYKKIWILLNLGVTFVGHGLRKDFRTINIHVPKSQVIDTVELFYHKGARQLSLRFLIWLLLDEQVQTGEHGHDSIEDARAALRLWQKWQDLEREGSTEKVLKEIYREGQRLGYRVPENGESSRLGKNGTRPVTPSAQRNGKAASKPVTPQPAPVKPKPVSLLD